MSPREWRYHQLKRELTGVGSASSQDGAVPGIRSRIEGVASRFGSQGLTKRGQAGCLSDMRIYRFRVLIDHPSEAFRDIEIGSDQSFLDLHTTIKDAFAFIGQEMACFYVSDEEWGKGPEIPLADLGFGMDGEAAPSLMDEVHISDHIRSTKQRFLYVYDFLHLWVFMVELIGATDPLPGVQYPRVAMSMGNAPDEHSKEMEMAEGILDDEDPYSSGPETHGYDDDDEDGFGDDDDEFGRHGSIDDLGEEYR